MSFFPASTNVGKMLITSFRLLYSRNALRWVSILLPPAALKGDVSCRIIVFLVQRAENTPLPMISEKVFRGKGFNQGIFIPSQLLGFPQNKVLSLAKWPKRTITSFKLQKSSACKDDGPKVRTTPGAAAAMADATTFAKKDESQAPPVNGNDAERGQFPSAFNQSNSLP